LKRWLATTLCAVLLTGACTQDSPTEAGSGLLPPDAIRTFEVVLPPETWLQWDTAFGVYSAPPDVDFVIAANAYEGSLNSRVLVRYTIPRTITVIDTLGVLRTDSTPTFFEGEMRMIVDTLASTAGPATLELFRTTQEWDRLTANWTLRIDSGNVQVPWAVPGGSPGAFIGSTQYTDNDSIALPIDSATIAAWSDTTDATRGGVLTSATPDTRLRTTLPSLRVRARSRLNPDTIVEVNLAVARTFIFEPAQPDSVGTPRVGGTPAWRTVLRLRERLDTVTVACPGIPGCSVRLGEAALSYAALQLQPVVAPPGFAPEHSMFVALFALLPSPLLPLQRSPLTGDYGATNPPIPPSSFTAAGAPIVELPATEFIRVLTSTPGSDDAFLPSHIALLPVGSPRTFGFGTFAELPSLRLIFSIARELQLP
jgi:hypothetical protein